MRRAAPALAADILCVLVFVLVGRSSHREALTLPGVAQTAWPFLVGLGAGWLLAGAAARGRRQSLRGGLVVWAVTVGAGMALRAIAGQGTEPAFVVVATVVLGALLLGWRAAAAAVVRSRTGTDRRRSGRTGRAGIPS